MSTSDQSTPSSDINPIKQVRIRLFELDEQIEQGRATEATFAEFGKAYADYINLRIDRSPKPGRISRWTERLRPRP